MTAHNNEEFGSQAFLWTSHEAGIGPMGTFGPTIIYEYKIVDPVSGNDMATVTDVPSAIAGLFSTSIGALIDGGYANRHGILFFGRNTNDWVDSGKLYMWNSTLMLAPPGPFGPGTAYKPSGSYNFTAGIQWSVALPAANPAYGIAVENNEAIVLSSYGSILPTFATQYGAATATDIAYDPKTGALLWGPVTQTLVEQDQVGIVAAGEGFYVRHSKDTNEAYGYSMKTGQKLWGPTELVGNALSHLFESAAIAYGKVYIWDYGGDCATPSILPQEN